MLCCDERPKGSATADNEPSPVEYVWHCKADFAINKCPKRPVTVPRRIGVSDVHLLPWRAVPTRDAVRGSLCLSLFRYQHAQRDQAIQNENPRGIPMNIQHRVLRPKDISECVKIVAEHPDFYLQYGKQIEPLRRALLRLVGSEGLRAWVFEDFDGATVRNLGVGAIGFLTAAFASEATTPPYFWIGPELIRRLLQGEMPFLSDPEVRSSNSNEGLNLFAWPLGFRSDYMKKAEVLNTLMGTFIHEVRGYKIKEFIGQSTDVEGTRASLNSGALLLTNRGSFRELPVEGAAGLLTAPHIIHIRRESALKCIGAWSSSIFVYQPPRACFSPSEQKLLLAALQGGTDDEVSDELAISLSAVKKAWYSIHDRAAQHLPEFILKNECQTERVNGERGKQKKQRLLSYLREHPEELRPFSRKAQKDCGMQMSE